MRIFNLFFISILGLSLTSCKSPELQNTYNKSQEEKEQYDVDFMFLKAVINNTKYASSYSYHATSGMNGTEMDVKKSSTRKHIKLNWKTRMLEDEIEEKTEFYSEFYENGYVYGKKEFTEDKFSWIYLSTPFDEEVSEYDGQIGQALDVLQYSQEHSTIYKEDDNYIYEWGLGLHAPSYEGESKDYFIEWANEIKDDKRLRSQCKFIISNGYLTEIHYKGFSIELRIEDHGNEKWILKGLGELFITITFSDINSTFVERPEDFIVPMQK